MTDPVGRDTRAPRERGEAVGHTTRKGGETMRSTHECIRFTLTFPWDDQYTVTITVVVKRRSRHPAR